MRKRSLVIATLIVGVAVASLIRLIVNSPSFTTSHTAVSSSKHKSPHPQSQPSKGILLPTHRKVYYCGYMVEMASHVFPEYEHMIDYEWSLEVSDAEYRRDYEREHPHTDTDSSTVIISPDDYHKNDILVVGMWGPACNGGRGDEKTAFAGKILYVNGEPSGDVVSAEWEKRTENTGDNEHTGRVYQIGPYPPVRGDESETEYQDFYNTHSLQVYHTAMEFMGYVYLGHSTNTTSWLRSWIVELDPWKHLVKGNGRSRDRLPRVPAIVYVSRNCVGFRQEMAEFLAVSLSDLVNTTETSIGKGAQDPSTSSPAMVHYGGECGVKGGIPVPPGVLEGWENRKRENFRSNYKTIYNRYKYCLVMENTVREGYVTEKLMHALLGGCLPIYYGSRRDVYEIFRNDAFIFLDVHDPEPALAEIRRLETTAEGASEYLRRTDRKLPILKGTDGDPYDTAKTVDEYFSLFPNIGTGKLCNKIHEMMGLPLP